MDHAEQINNGKITIVTESGSYANVREKDGMRFGPSLNDLVKNGLLPTPQASDIINENRKITDPAKMNRPTDLARFVKNGLLPTPQARDEKNGSKLEDSRIQRKIDEGWTIDLNDLATCGMLPTPATRDYKGARTTEALEEAGRNGTNSLPDFFAQTGQTSQLNPLFVTEMMGYPIDWLVLPFQGGEKNP